MANPETIINSIRRQCTDVFEACQGNLDAVDQDRDDFIAELGAEFFTDWFDTVVGYDITFQQLVDAVQAMETLRASFEGVRSKLQIARLR
jgi:hypothetical protein